MAKETGGASRIQRCRGIIGAPGLGRGLCGRPGDRHGLFLNMFQLADLARHALDLELTRAGVGVSGRGSGFRGPEAPSGEVERVPTQAQPPRKDRGRNDQSQRQQDPAERDRQTKQGPHGNTFLSSSKCGPSRSVGQSPPQTMAVPWRTAAALKAAAMRGYSGQSQRT